MANSNVRVFRDKTEAKLFHNMRAWFPDPFKIETYWSPYHLGQYCRVEHRPGGRAVDNLVDDFILNEDGALQEWLRCIARQVHYDLLQNHVAPEKDPDQGVFYPLNIREQEIQALFVIAGLEARWRAVQGLEDSHLWMLVKPGKWATPISHNHLKNHTLEDWQEIVTSLKPD